MAGFWPLGKDIPLLQCAGALPQRPFPLDSTPASRPVEIFWAKAQLAHEFTSVTAGGLHPTPPHPWATAQIWEPTVGAIVQAVHGVARQAETAVREVLEQVRASPVVQGDETGWRQDGSNGYVLDLQHSQRTILPASGSG